MPNSVDLMYKLSPMAFSVKQSKLMEIATRYDDSRSLWKQTIIAILSNVFENILVNCFCLWMQYQQLRQLTDVVLHNAKEKKHSPENLAQSAMLLSKNPEVYTIWNYRREALANVLEVSQSYTSPEQYWSKSTLYLHIGCLHWIFEWQNLFIWNEWRVYRHLWHWSELLYANRIIYLKVHPHLQQLTS